MSDAEHPLVSNASSTLISSIDMPSQPSDMSEECKAAALVVGTAIAKAAQHVGSPQSLEDAHNFAEDRPTQLSISALAACVPDQKRGR